ncbi:hypothetical protein BH23ACT11_BH23ACT11_18870 [soil metagenome]
MVMEPLKIFVLYSGWFLIVLVVAMLWFVAMVDIRNHMRKQMFETAHLVVMAASISVIAVGTLASANAVVLHGWIEAPRVHAMKAASASGDCESFSYSFTYSFGVERPARISQECIGDIEPLH